jgi:hypothetical protein
MVPGATLLLLLASRSSIVYGSGPAFFYADVSPSQAAASAVDHIDVVPLNHFTADVSSSAVDHIDVSPL